VADKKIELSTAIQKIQPLAGSAVLHAPVESLSTDDVTTAWAALDLIEDLVKERKEALRARLLQEAVDHGQVTDMGGFTFTIDGTKVVREKREYQPKAEEVVGLLQKHGIAVLEGCDEITTLVVNPSKIEHLISIGKLDREEWDLTKKTTWALKVKLSKPLAEYLDNARKAITALPLEEETPPAAALPEATPAKPKKSKKSA
jgi:hypothetical protein